MQKDLSLVINCLSCYMNSCAWGTILGSLCILTHSNCIRTFVQLYSCTILHCGYNTDTLPHSIFLCRCFSNENIHKQLMLVNRSWSFLIHCLFGFGNWIHVNQFLHRNGEEQYRPQLIDRGLTSTTTMKNPPSV